MEVAEKVTTTLEDKEKDTLLGKNGVTSTIVENGEVKDKCGCECGCQMRLEKAEKELKELVTWKVNRQEWEDMILKWKTQVEEWVQSTFGCTVTGPVDLPIGGGGEEEPKASTIDANTSQSGLSDNPMDDINLDDMDALLSLGGEEAENLEITPDLLGHFLLDNEYDHGDSVDDVVEDVGSQSDDGLSEEEESEVPVRNGRDRSKTKKARNNDNSDSECFTVSSASSESSSDEYTSDEDFELKKKPGRGRPRGRYNISSQVRNTAAGQNRKPSSTADIVHEENQKKLVEFCRKRDGNIWECTVCGFMLTSLENMLLHIKYNHSSSTHTCPYCRIVVLCRSPKDAITHQAECKMRPPFNSTSSSQDNRSRPVQKTVVPVPIPKVIRPPVTTYVPKKLSDINAEIDKFVGDLLNAETCTAAKTPTASSSKHKNNNKKTDDMPAVVTLSSDED